MTSAIPLPILYAGLAGCLLSLVVATATNRWQPRVFFLLALRLAIGWHFLFEGLHKIHSHHVGPTDANRPFTSEPYFAAAKGPFGEYMRRQYLGDTDALLAAKVFPKRDISAAEFMKLPPAERAALCPDGAAKELDAAIADAAKAEEAKAQYGRWVYGDLARDAKVKFVNGDVPLSAPERLSVIALLKKQSAELADRQAAGLGTGYGYEMTRTTGAEADLRTAKADLLADADKYLAELKQLAGVKPEEAEKADKAKPEKPIASLDKMTMWMITAVGACLLFGLFTPVACAVGAGFLAMTYLTHPPFPWYPLPPSTEGNPLFVNKNVIEALAMLAIAAHPTGRWLGLDALLVRLFRRNRAMN